MAARAVPPPQVVREVGGFVLVRELGEGGMGKVFLARQRSLDRLVALKVLPPRLAGDVEFVLRFHREAKAAALFQHPNVVAVIDQGTDEKSGVHYIAFEYLEGGSVEGLLAKRGGRLEEAEALRIARGVASGLSFAEGKGVVHRDVKPDNILIDAHGTPKLADLGLARREGDAGNVTQTGVVLGTPLYMAPEQALGEPLDVRADLYALGLCLWRMLTGKVPFAEDGETSALQILSRHVQKDLPDPRTVRPDVSEAAARVIAGLSAREREGRYATAALAVRDLDRALSGDLPEGPVAASATTAIVPALRGSERVARQGSGSGRAVRASDRARTAPPLETAAPPATSPRGFPAVGVVAIAAALATVLGVVLGLRPGGPPAPGPAPVAFAGKPREPAPPAPAASAGEPAPAGERPPPPGVEPPVAPPREPAPPSPARVEPEPEPTPAPEERPPAPTPARVDDGVAAAALARELEAHAGLLYEDVPAARAALPALEASVAAASLDAPEAAAAARYLAASRALLGLVERPGLAPERAAIAEAELQRALEAPPAAGAPGAGPVSRVSAAALEALRKVLGAVEVLRAVLGEPLGSPARRADAQQLEALAPEFRSLLVGASALQLTIETLVRRAGAFEDAPAPAKQAEERTLIAHLLADVAADFEALRAAPRPASVGLVLGAAAARGRGDVSPLFAPWVWPLERGASKVQARALVLGLPGAPDHGRKLLEVRVAGMTFRVRGRGVALGEGPAKPLPWPDAPAALVVELDGPVLRFHVLAAGTGAATGNPAFFALGDVGPAPEVGVDLPGGAEFALRVGLPRPQEARRPQRGGGRLGDRFREWRDDRPLRDDRGPRR